MTQEIKITRLDVSVKQITHNNSTIYQPDWKVCTAQRRAPSCKTGGLKWKGQP